MGIRWNYRRAICKRNVKPQAGTVTEKHSENLYQKILNFIGKYLTTQNGRLDLAVVALLRPKGHQQMFSMYLLYFIYVSY